MGMGHNYSHTARCGMCRNGDPTKSLKKVRGTQQRLRWKDTLCDAAHRNADWFGGFNVENAKPAIGPAHAPRGRELTLKEFIVKARDEIVVSEDSEVPCVIVRSLCPIGCSCRPKRAGRKVLQTRRDRTFQANAGVPPPVDDEWLVV